MSPAGVRSHEKIKPWWNIHRQHISSLQPACQVLHTGPKCVLYKMNSLQVSHRANGDAAERLHIQKCIKTQGYEGRMKFLFLTWCCATQTNKAILGMFDPEAVFVLHLYRSLQSHKRGPIGSGLHSAVNPKASAPFVMASTLVDREWLRWSPTQDRECVFLAEGPAVTSAQVTTCWYTVVLWRPNVTYSSSSAHTLL